MTKKDVVENAMTFSIILLSEVAPLHSLNIQHV
jgi:hypothetical protein